MAQQHDTSKNQMEMVENSAIVPGDGALAMRAKADDLSVLQSMRKYKRVGIIAIVASFCAALDGYRKASLTSRSALLSLRTHMLIGCVNRNQP
jgi:hypothetical protein